MTTKYYTHSLEGKPPSEWQLFHASGPPGDLSNYDILESICVDISNTFNLNASPKIEF